MPGRGRRRGREAAGKVVSRPQIEPLPGPFPCALSVDVEEWYHTCLAPELNEPERRPVLPRELDRLLPDLLELFAAHGCRATFFVLGEVAREVPRRVREIVEAGHEVACHGLHHLRAGSEPPQVFASHAAEARKILEDTCGRPVTGFRAPEWSLRQPANPRLRLLAARGFRYDSSLAPVAGAGRRDNPRRVCRLRWSDGSTMLEVPPLTWGGRLRLPGNGWPARLAPPAWLSAAARQEQAAGGLPLFVVHPWELADRLLPGELTGLARFVHETGRYGYRRRFELLLASLPPTVSVAEALADAGERNDGE